MTRHYLDHASTSPLRPEAQAAMVAWLEQSPGAIGDPSRIHHEGMTARVAIETAREQVAVLLGARTREVVFTSGATEAIVAAVRGAAERSRERAAAGGAREDAGPPHQVVPAVEHSAVREAAARAGNVTVVGVDHKGRVDPEALLAAIEPRTALVHLQWANHEVGTVQEVHDVVARCRARGVLVHVDAAQAAGRLPIAFDELGADLLSVSGHKLGGPPGTGALLVRRGLRLPPLLVGGDQERARRAGLENVPAIVGFGAAAAALTTGNRIGDEAAVARRQTAQVLAAAEQWDGVDVYGDPDNRVPHLVCLGTRGVEPQAVLLGLDQAGIAAHSGSACASEALEPSPVLEAMGVDAHRSLRVSVGWNTSDSDIDAIVDAVPAILTRLRSLAGQLGD